MEITSSDKNKPLLPKSENIAVKDEFPFDPSQFSNDLNFNNFSTGKSLFTENPFDRLMYNQTLSSNPMFNPAQFNFLPQFHNIVKSEPSPEMFDKLKWSEYFSNADASPPWSSGSSVSGDTTQVCDPFNSFDFQNDDVSYDSGSFDFSEESVNPSLVNTMDLIVESSNLIPQKRFSDIDIHDNIFVNSYNDSSFHQKGDAEIVLDSLIKQYINSEAIGSTLPDNSSQNLLNPAPTQAAKLSNSSNKSNTSSKKIIAPKSSSLKSKTSPSSVNPSHPLKSIQPLCTPTVIKSEFEVSNVSKPVKAIRKSPCSDFIQPKINSFKKIKIEPLESDPFPETSSTAVNPIPSTPNTSKLTSILPKSKFSTRSLPPGHLFPEPLNNPLLNLPAPSFSNPLENLTNSVEKKQSITTNHFSSPTPKQQLPPRSSESIPSVSRLSASTDQAAAKRQERLIKNRAAALQSRKKRREHMDFLESKVKGLENENNTLKEDLENTKSLLQEAQRQLSSLNLGDSKSLAKTRPYLVKQFKPKEKSSELIHNPNNWIFEAHHSKHNLVSSFIMAVLFSFTMFCIPSTLDTNSSSFGTSSHEIPIQLRSETLSLSKIPSVTSFEIDSGIIKEELDDLDDQDNDSVGNQIMEVVRKSFQELSRKISPSQSVPAVFPSELTCLSYDDNAEELYSKHALELVDHYNHRSKSQSGVIFNKKIVPHWSGSESDKDIEISSTPGSGYNSHEVDLYSNSVKKNSLKLLLPPPKLESQDLESSSDSTSNFFGSQSLGLRDPKSDSIISPVLSDDSEPFSDIEPVDETTLIKVGSTC
ncbi:Cyclic AMP-responsive element-binding protein 1 [Smittium mucronatum]|uniref:Cyclic AMP-responsive element-binding protein 1 n=1 Tax=Smittium mucronatum TaxID=133383 RepID=A0A1R0H6K6_9FUNG|nr:Cyclic AMP-responsive element-binding protein 1 [Smittium mucronatum]OLY84756.1 Cyclic AMP-responsive element-binding protein 1 [Smittium mucronatum]